MIYDFANSFGKFKNASELASYYNIDVSGWIKHIKQYRKIEMTISENKCGNKRNCSIEGLCSICRNRKSDKSCKYCKLEHCNKLCPNYTLTPNCKRVNKYPYVCNGCIERQACRFNKLIYDPSYVVKELNKNRSDPRKGCHADESELKRLSNLLVPLIKEKHQSLPQVFLTHKEEIRWSYVTILKLIDNHLIPGLTNGDLTKRVTYPISYKKHKDEPTNLAFLTNRTYDDFVCFISDNPNVEVVEMDTVLSCRGSNYCLLTMLFRKSNYMMAFLLKDKTVKEVSRIFNYFKKELGIELFKNTFRCILTDNGSEFADPRYIEFNDDTGEQIINLFYCDPGRSGQKGKIEKNHVELRKVFPKGTDFARFTQEEINIALSHINSEPRQILNRNSPGTIARLFLNEKVLALNKYQSIDADKVTLHPSLLK